MSFIQYLKPLDANTIKTKVQLDIKELQDKVNLFNLLASELKSWEGKVINKRLITFIETKTDYHFRLDISSFGNRIDLIAYKNGDSTYISLSKNESKRFNLKEFNDLNTWVPNAITNINQRINHLPAIDILTKRYNNILTEAQQIEKDAERFGFPYMFDIANNK
jgi:hypothetical protein